MDGNIEITKVQGYVFTDSVPGDVVYYTSSSAQRMLFGTQTQHESAFLISSNLVEVNRRCRFSSNVGIYVDDPVAALHTSRDIFVSSNDFEWPSAGGRGLYVRYSTNADQDASYVQSIERDDEALSYQDMRIEARNFHVSTGGSNAIDRLKIEESGRIGLNTNSPLEALDVRGSVAIDSNLSMLAGRSILLGSNLATNHAARVGCSIFGNNELDVVGSANAYQSGRRITFHVDSNVPGGQQGLATFKGGAVFVDFGNVGIGAPTPVAALHMAKQNTTSNNVLIEAGKTTDAANEGFSAINFNGYYSGGDRRVNSQKNRWRLLVDQRAQAEHMSVDAFDGTNVYAYATLSNANVGIDKSNPVARLHVRCSSTTFGGVDGTQTSNHSLTIEDSSGGPARIVHLSTHAAQSVVFNFQTGKNVFWGESNDAGAYLFRGRSVSIGASNPDKALVVGSGSADATSAIKINTAEGDKLYLTHNLNGSKISHASPSIVGFHAGPSNAYSGSFAFLTGSNIGYVERVRLNSNGFVGIATETPAYLLHVAGSFFASNISIGKQFLGLNPDSAELPSFSWSNDNSNGMFRPATNTVAFSTNATERMRITQTGYVGIGTQAPNAPLQLSNVIANRKIVLWEDANNDHQYYGFGVNAFTLRYQTSAAGADHVFYSGASASSSKELLRIKGDGKVGIGVNPSFDFQAGANSASLDGKTFLVNTFNTTNTMDLPGAVFRQSNQYCFIHGNNMTVQGGDATLYRLSFNTTNNVGNIDATRKDTSAGVTLKLQASGGASTFGGRVGVGVASPSYALHVSGTVYATMDVISYSDSNVKADLRRIDDALKKVDGLSGYTFERTDLYEKGKRYTGMIAQDVERVLPEAVYRDEKGCLAIAYGNTIGLIVEAIKALNKKPEIDAISEIMAIPEHQASLVVGAIQSQQRRIEDIERRLSALSGDAQVL